MANDANCRKQETENIVQWSAEPINLWKTSEGYREIKGKWEVLILQEKKKKLEGKSKYHKHELSFVLGSNVNDIGSAK
jgi:hypothetical protein